MFTRKGIYHSELVNAGPVTVTIKSDVLKSTFAGNPDYVKVTINGRDHTIQCETPQIAASLNGRKNQTVSLVASGSRESAQIAVMAPGSSPQFQQPAQPQQQQWQQPAAAAPVAPPYTPLPAAPAAPVAPAPMAAPAAQGWAPSHPQPSQQPAQSPQSNVPHNPPVDPEHEMGRALNAMHLAFNATVALQKRLNGQLTQEHLQAVCSSFFIYLDKHGIIKELPRDPVSFPNFVDQYSLPF